MDGVEEHDEHFQRTNGGYLRGVLAAITGLVIASAAIGLVLANSSDPDEVVDTGPNETVDSGTGIQQPPSSTTAGGVIEPDPDYREVLRSARFAIDS
jgi:hypothetical protein